LLLHLDTDEESGLPISSTLKKLPRPKPRLKLKPKLRLRSEVITRLH